MSANPVHVVCPECATVNRVAEERLGEAARCGRCKQRLFAGKPVALGDENFDTHIAKSDLPVVVDFWAPWCGPCRMMAPAFEQAAADLEPSVRLAKLNTEEAPRVASRFGIRSIPTLAIFRGGTEIARQSGALDYGTLTRWIRSHV
ncbi:MAG: thioredoxin TrxC [Burkholderiales bacterium]